MLKKIPEASQAGWGSTGRSSQCAGHHYHQVVCMWSCWPHNVLLSLSCTKGMSAVKIHIFWSCNEHFYSLFSWYYSLLAKLKPRNNTTKFGVFLSFWSTPFFFLCQELNFSLNTWFKENYLTYQDMLSYVNQWHNNL